MKNGHQRFISRPEVKFWVPILIYTVTLTIGFMNIKSDLRNLTTVVSSYTSKTDNLQAAINSTIQCTIRLDTNNICAIR